MKFLSFPRVFCIDTFIPTENADAKGSMMTLTKGMIDKLRFPGRMDIDKELEARLLLKFGTEPHPEEYSEQDLHEQVRKYVMLSNKERETVL